MSWYDPPERLAREIARRAEIDAAHDRDRAALATAIARKAARDEASHRRLAARLEARRQYRASSRRVGPPIPLAHVGHDLFTEARRIVPGAGDDPAVQDLRSVAVVALIEGIDPWAAVAEALRADRRALPYMAKSLDAVIPGTEALRLIDTIAADGWGQSWFEVPVS